MRREAKVAVGSEIDGYSVERIVNVRPGIDTVVEASRDAGHERALLTFPAPGVCASGETRRELLRLARLRSSLSHPHLAPLLVVSQHGRNPYLVSPVPGGTLAERLEARGPELDETLEILAQVAGALDAAAAQGLVHRDLTPAAIAHGESAGEPLNVQLTDFGVTLPAAGCGSFATLKGAPYYAPEAIRGEELTARSNVYALTCILYECLTGTAPYTYDRPLLTLHAHLVEPVPRVSRRARRLPAALDEPLAQGLAKEPGRRHASAGELAVHVGAALGRPLQIAVPAVPVEDEPKDRPREAGRPRFPLPRQRWAWAAAALALVVSGVSGFGIGSAGGSGDPHAQPATPLSTAAERMASRQRTDYVRSVGRSVERLDGRRLAGRARLRRARGARAQAEAARALARTYRATRAELPAPVSSLGAAGLGDGLGDADRAYRRLAAAARRRDLRAWRKAAEQAVSSERDIERALQRLRSGYDRA